MRFQSFFYFINLIYFYDVAKFLKNLWAEHRFVFEFYYDRQKSLRKNLLSSA